MLSKGIGILAWQSDENIPQGIQHRILWAVFPDRFCCEIPNTTYVAVPVSGMIQSIAQSHFIPSQEKRTLIEL